MKKTKKQFKMVICKFCKWVHFEISRKHAIKEVTDFNKYFDTLPKQLQEDFYGGKKSSIRNYEYCHLCGTCYHNFRNAKNSEVPNGSTINPIISRKD